MRWWTLERVLRVAFIAACLVFALDGKHPPAEAQNLTTDQRDQLREDVRQDDRLDDLKRQQDRMDGRMQEMWKTTNSNANSLASLTTEVRGIAAGLALLQGGIFAAGRKPGGRRSNRDES